MEAGRLKQIEEIYHAALEVAPEKREAFLQNRCGADAELRREVESLLSFENASGKFIDAPPESLAAEMFAKREKGANLLDREIAHYKIKRLLGRGGMGEVYLAEDTRLNRPVALKILPEDFAADARRLKRFEREARAVSALNHPNILTVHEFGADDDAYFLATEFVEGETVREKISGGELSLVDALKIAEQTAFALSAAHAAGIVHRDIKPENIMMRRDGIVKVLDFGIAKLAAPTGELVDTEGETLEKKWTATQPGAMIGTLAYMSPEQVRGKTIDARSDVFSLGVVLYEMLTGKDPFERATSGDIIAAILTENPPPVTEKKPNAPAELGRILNKALKKNCDERYQTSRDFLLDLKSLRREIEFAGANTARTGGAASGENKTRLTGAANAQTTNEVTAAHGGFSPAQWLSIFLVAILVIGGAWWFALKRDSQNATIQPTVFNAVEVVNWRSTPGEIYSVGAFSPDAKMVAFASTRNGGKNIWVKQLAGGEAVQITKDEFANQNPVWSPNGDEIAFYSTRGGTSGIWRMPSLGGTPTFIKAFEDGSLILRRWSKTDRIYYESRKNLFALDLKTGQTNQLTNFDAATVSANNFSVSADEKRIACVTFENGRYGILTMPAQEAGGAPEQIFDGGADEIRNLVWHADGRRVLYSQKTGGAFQIFAVEANGKPVQITNGERDAFALDASADEGKILYGASKEESDVWGVNVERAEEFSFAADINSELWAAPAPDGKTVAFQSIKNLSQGDKICCGAILTKRIEQPGAETFQLVAEGSLPAFSPDGKRLAFVRLAGKTFSLWIVGAAGGAEKQLTSGGLPPVENTILPYNRTQTSSYDWSPDSAKIAYVAGENSESDIWLVDADDASRIRLTDNADANVFLYCPLWSIDGKRVAFTSKMNKADGDGKRYFGVSIVDAETKNVKSVARTENFQRLLGFSASGNELLLAEVKGKSPSGAPVETMIAEVNIETGERRQIAKLDAAYLYNVRLSADKKMLGYVANRDGKDDIWLLRLAAVNSEARKITSNNDNRLYFSSLAWSPDSRAIYFGKQTRYSLLSMVTNFK